MKIVSDLFYLEFSRKYSLKLAPNYYNYLKYKIVYKTKIGLLEKYLLNFICTYIIVSKFKLLINILI